jgi:hypothetical protein
MVSVEKHEEHSLRVFEDMEHRGISVAECEEVTGRWRKIRYEELHNYTLHQM